MKVLLVNPPFYRFIGLEQDYVPLSLLAVGSQLHAEGHEVQIKNLEIAPDLQYMGYVGRADDFDKHLVMRDHVVWNELRAVISEFKPDQIGISVLGVKFNSAMEVKKVADEFGIRTMVGGPFPTMSPDRFPADVEVIRGEFESRYKDARLKDLDELPMPHYASLLDSYSPNGYAHVVGSRGCPYSCTFCASRTMWQRKVSVKSPQRLLTEMTEVVQKFGSDVFTFWDETFTLGKSRLLEFCRIYDLPAKWNCDTRANSLDEEMLVAMKQAKCQHISVGVESGRQHVLDYIKKGEKLADFVRAAELLHSLGIQWKAYVIAGFPIETEADMFETIRFVKSLQPFRITFSAFTPYPGTELFEECVAKNLITREYDPSRFAHQSPHNYFAPKVPKERHLEVMRMLMQDVDDYNKSAIESWK